MQFLCGSSERLHRYSWRKYQQNNLDNNFPRRKTNTGAPWGDTIIAPFFLLSNFFPPPPPTFVPPRALTHGIAVATVIWCRSHLPLSESQVGGHAEMYRLGLGLDDILYENHCVPVVNIIFKPCRYTCLLTREVRVRLNQMNASLSRFTMATPDLHLKRSGVDLP